MQGMLDDGSVPVWRRLDDDSEFIDELLRKLTEEIAEARQKAALDPGEIIDVMEVFEWLAKLNADGGVSAQYYGFLEEVDEAITPDWDELEDWQAYKRNAFGSFTTRTFVERVTVDDSSQWIQHYLDNPTRYPEVNTGQGGET